MRYIQFIPALMIFFFHTISYGQNDQSNTIAPNGKYQIFLNEKDIDSNSRYFESFVVDLQSGDTIALAKNYKPDAQSPLWFWDQNSQHLIFEGNEYGSVAKLQIWDLEDRFLLYELRGSIPADRSEGGASWDSKNELLYFCNCENIEAPKSLVLNLKTRKIKYVDESKAAIASGEK